MSSRGPAHPSTRRGPPAAASIRTPSAGWAPAARAGPGGAPGVRAPRAPPALPLIGRGEVEWRGRLMPAADALRQAGLGALQLQAKEGLALLNGTQMMTALRALGLHDAERLLGTASTVAAMSIEALLRTG